MGRKVQPVATDSDRRLAAAGAVPGEGAGGSLSPVQFHISLKRVREMALEFIFRNTDDGVEILAKSSKSNQARVIERLRSLYEN